MNFSTTIRRICTAGAKHFARGGSVTVATVLVMTVTLGIISTLMFLSAIIDSTVTTVRDQVDINVYFVTTASDSDIEDFVARVKKLPEVESATVTSRDDVLAQFRERHESDQITLQALDELAGNPFGAMLTIQAKNPTEYASIADFLSSDPVLSADGTSVVDRVNYPQNKNAIDHIIAATRIVERAGLTFVLLFAFASVVIAFGTIRLAIHSSRDEVAVMRLVGAPDSYIRGPFIVAGVMSGLLAAFICLLILFPVSWYLGSSFEDWLSGFNLFSYYTQHFAYIFFVLVGSGIMLGAVASFLAVRRYLRV